MAGGMNGGGRGRSLRERTGAPETARTTTAADEPDLGGRHCWVRDEAAPDTPWPGLLVEWRRAPDGWEGLVTYAVRAGSTVTLTQAWVPAGSLVAR